MNKLLWVLRFLVITGCEINLQVSYDKIASYFKLLSFKSLLSVTCQLHLLAPMQGSSSLQTRNPQLPSHAKDPLASPKGWELHTRQTG